MIPVCFCYVIVSKNSTHTHKVKVTTPSSSCRTLRPWRRVAQRQCLRGVGVDSETNNDVRDDDGIMRVASLPRSNVRFALGRRRRRRRRRGGGKIIDCHNRAIRGRAICSNERIQFRGEIFVLCQSCKFYPGLEEPMNIQHYTSSHLALLICYH